MPSWKLLSHSARGFSLTEVMVGGAILAGIAVSGARLFKDQRNSQAKLDSEQHLMQFHMNLTKFLQDERNCNATFQRVGAAGASLINVTPATLVATPISLMVIYPCSNCTVQGFNYDLASTARGTPYISPFDWIENVNGATGRELGIWTYRGMRWKPTYTQPTGTGTFMVEVIYRSNPAFSGSRATKMETVIKDIAVNLRFTQHADPNQRYFKECFSSKESAVNNLQVDVCKTMTQLTSSGNIMGWQDATQGCQAQGSVASPVKTCPNPGDVVAGIKADGTVNCVRVNKGINPSLDLANPATSCAPGMSIRLNFNTVTKRLEPVCF